MALFLSTYENRIDKKGRVSVPASFRSELSGESFQGVVLFRSNNHDCLEGFAWSYMQEISNRLDNFDLFSDEQDDLASSIFGDAVQLPLDGDGRIILSPDLIQFAGLKEKAAFVGMGVKFQVWCPEKFSKRREEARKKVQSQNLTLPKAENTTDKAVTK
jgi:MraZ protein